MSLFPAARTSSSPNSPPPRPSQVTRAAIQAIVGSVIVLLAMATIIARLKSQEMADFADQLRKEPMLKGSNLSRDDTLNLLRLSATICASACVASLVFAVFVLRRHNASRIGLTVLGGLLVVSGIMQPLIGWLVAAYVALAIYLLWSPPARAWFAWKPGAPMRNSGHPTDSSPPPWSRPPPPPPRI
jgi:hypothetical protein